jgi:hypothetical protein
MKRTVLTVLWLLISAVSLAQTYSNTNLNGQYSIQFGQPAYDTWSKTFACPTNTSITYTPVGSTTTMTMTYGVGTFDGAGNVSFTMSNSGKMNATASANTMSVTWSSSCQVTGVNNGHIVYQAVATQAGTGTYSVKSNGTGTLTVSGGKGSLGVHPWAETRS